jgi:hypothetical protein
MMWLWLTPLLLVVALVLVVLFWRPLKAFGREVQLGRALELFKLQRERLHDNFYRAAAATGKPRGLRWKECQWDGEAKFARDRQTGQIAALVPVMIQFEAIEGSDMEDNPNVGLVRNASAVFFFNRGQWHTVGRAVFNMSPDEALNHFRTQYERLGAGR